MKKKFLLQTFLIIFFYAAHAQKPIAFGSEKGIYLLNPMEPAASAFPFRNGTHFLVERADGNTNRFTRLFTYETPSTFDNFMEREKVYELHAPYPVAIPSSHFAEAWEAFQTVRSWDSLKNYIAEQPVMAAFGILLFDETAQKNTSYSYRISLLTNNDSVIQSHTSTAVSYPEQMTYSKPSYAGVKTDGNVITVSWRTPAFRKPHHFKIFRAQNQGQYVQVGYSAFIIKIKDSLYYSFTDDNVDNSSVYKYFISPSNNFGNYNVFSDTAIAISHRAKDIDLPTHLKAISVDSINAIRLLWQLPSPEMVGNISIIKSTNYDTGYYEEVALSGSDTGYLDQNVAPGQKYYYYLKLADRLGNVTVNSSRFFGLQTGSGSFLGTVKLFAKPERDGVDLSWVPNGSAINGFYMYRSEGADSDNLKPVSPFIKYSGDSLMRWKDTASDLRPGVMYGYAIRQESNGNVEGAFSKTVMVMPLHASARGFKMAMVNLSVTALDKSALLVWDTRANLPDVGGINIYRRSENESFRMINSVPLNSYITGFEDSIVNLKSSYTYRLSFVDIHGKEIGKSSEVTLSNPIFAVPPPYELTAQKNGNTVQLNWEYAGKDIRFIVYKRSPGKAPKAIATLDGNTLMFADSNTSEEHSIAIYYVTAKNNKGAESNPSNECKVVY